MEDGQLTGQKFEWNPIPIPPPPFNGVRIQRERITKQDIDEFGATIGCQGCNAIKDNRRAQAHSDRCRKRIEESLRNTPHGADRLNRRDELINEALAEEGSTAPETNGRIGSAGIERKSHRTRPKSKEEIAHEVSIVDGQWQWSTKGEETKPGWIIESTS